MNFPQFLITAHISAANCDEMAAGEIDQENQKFLALNVHFNHLNSDLLGLKSLSYGGLKFWYSFKTQYYFTARCT